MGLHDSGTTGVLVSRRRVLAAGGSVLVAGGSVLVAGGTRESAAQVELGDWSVDDTSAEVDGHPSDIRLTADGTFEVSMASRPEMVEVVAQVDVDGDVDDLATEAFYDTRGGSFSVDTSLYEHRDISRGDLTPETAGETASVPVVIRAIVRVVDGGETITEASAEDSGTLELTRAGVSVGIGGSATLEVEQ